MRYASELDRRNTQEELYRVYVTDSFSALIGANKRYADLLHPVEDFDVDDVISDVIERAGLEVIG